MVTKLQCAQCGKKFTPKYPKQKDCSELCLCNRFDTLTKKTRAIAKVYALTMGYRSMSEVRFAARLKDMRVKFDYEKDSLIYQHEPQKYVVDFSVKAKDGHDIFIEYKGKLDADTRRKMKAIKKSNPDADIRFVFEKPNNKIYKGAKMRYGDWATKAGFKWYDVKDWKILKKELVKTNERKKKQET